MTSQTKNPANKRNAARSTGPRTVAGKKRASRNAYKHGLSVSIRYEPGNPEKIEALAAAIAGKHAKPSRLQAAREVAERELEVRRFHAFKLSLFEAEETDIHAIAKIVDDGSCNDGGDENKVALGGLRDPSVLTKLERYERRVFSRHWRALQKYAIAIEEEDA